MVRFSSDGFVQFGSVPGAGALLVGASQGRRPREVYGSVRMKPTKTIPRDVTLPREAGWGAVVVW